MHFILKKNLLFQEMLIYTFGKTNAYESRFSVFGEYIYNKIYAISLNHHANFKSRLRSKPGVHFIRSSAYKYINIQTTQ